MIRLITILSLVLAGLPGLVVSAQEGQPLSKHLEPLRPFIGKTWKGVFQNPDSSKKTVDISRWERALNGQAVRILHSLNDGEYGGETLIYWDSKQEKLLYYYFTTGGFMTRGTIVIDGQQYIGHEVVSGDASGITEVKSSGELLPDGSMKSTATYLQNGQWVPGHSIVYREDPDAKVIFR